MKVINISTTKTARFYILGEATDNIRQVWFACHGYGQLAEEFITGFQVLNNGYHLIIAPEGLHRFYVHGGTGKVGASWMTKEDRFNDINDYINYLDQVYEEVMKQEFSPEVKITALGFSQGTASVCRWALQGKSPIHRLILWGGDFPPDTDWLAAGERLKNLDVHLVYGDKDHYVKPALIQQQTELLKKNNIKFRLHSFNGSHEIDPGMLSILTTG